MRVLGLSDLHIGLNRLGNWGIEVARRAAEWSDIDVLYFGGDLVESSKDNPDVAMDNLKLGLETLAKSSAEVKLFTLGNNDLEMVQESVLSEHYNEMRKLVGEYGFHLLDHSPCIVDGVAFIGNVGWYDGSLWRRYEGKSDNPNIPDLIRKTVTAYFQESEFKGKIPDGYTPDMFYEECRRRLEMHLDIVCGDKVVEKVVVGIHCVPSEDFLKYDSAEFNYLNWCMGAEGHKEHYNREKVVLGFTGHTHRSASYDVGDVRVHNLSGKDQPKLFDV